LEGALLIIGIRAKRKKGETRTREVQSKGPRDGEGGGEKGTQVSMIERKRNQLDPKPNLCGNKGGTKKRQGQKGGKRKGLRSNHKGCGAKKTQRGQYKKKRGRKEKYSSLCRQSRKGRKTEPKK